jgi:hypothetical protein
MARRYCLSVMHGTDKTLMPTVIHSTVFVTHVGHISIPSVNKKIAPQYLIILLMYVGPPSPHGCSVQYFSKESPDSPPKIALPGKKNPETNLQKAGVLITYSYRAHL